MLILIILIAAFIIFLLRTFNTTSPKIDLLAAGLALVTLALCLRAYPG